LNYERGPNLLNWEARALVPVGIVCELASTDENHVEEFWFCRIPMMSHLHNIHAI
jgi:hypothetical protein